MEIAPEKYLTKKERLYFNALADADTIKNAATKLGLAPQTLYNWIYNLKHKYKNRRGWINAVISQKKRNSLIKDILTEKKSFEAPESDFEDDDSPWLQKSEQED